MTATMEDVKQLLEKKATFERGCRILAAQLRATPTVDYMPLVSRTYTLLKTRHSNVAFWKSGLEVFQAAAGLVPDTKATQYLTEAQQFINNEDGEPASEPEPQAAQSLYPVDMLLGLGSRQPVTSHFDDAGLRIDPPTVTAQAQHATAADTAVSSETQQQEGTDSDAAEPIPTSWQEQQQQILLGIQAVYDGMSAVQRGTNAVEVELEQVLAMLGDRFQQPAEPRAPPMSKKVFESLPRLDLTAEKLEEIGQDAACAVCTDTFKAGDQVLQLPCRGKHWYHPACIKPWVSKTNSCPVCREELPTDDHNYEANKEKAAEAALERAGAANALSHNEFMYI